jgi:hypothetical protein
MFFKLSIRCTNSDPVHDGDETEAVSQYEVHLGGDLLPRPLVGRPEHPGFTPHTFHTVILCKKDWTRGAIISLQTIDHKHVQRRMYRSDWVFFVFESEIRVMIGSGRIGIIFWIGIGIPFRIPPIWIGINSKQMKKLFSLENFNMLAKLLKIMAHLTLMRKIKHC